MTGESPGPEDRRWLVEPPGPHQIQFAIASGDQLDVTLEIQQAFERLLGALRSEDVQGYEMETSCGGYRQGCTKNVFACSPRRGCTVETQTNCFIDYNCKIAGLG
jgi:hypothetical protein